MSNILYNTIRCKKLATIVSGRKYVVWPFVRWTGKYECRNITATKDTTYFGTRATSFRPEIIVQNFASYGVIIQSVTLSFLKMPVCGASLTYNNRLS